MKKCTYCGKEYPEEALVCAIDHEPLESDIPKPNLNSEVNNLDAVETEAQVDEETDVPEGFRCLGKFDTLEASRLLKKFETEKIRFLIDRIEKSVETGRGFRKIGLIEIDVHQDDYETANNILLEDWKV
jgi:hypothetical protein